MLKEIVEEASTDTLGIQYINVSLKGKQGVVRRKNPTHSKRETMRIGSNSVRGQEGILRYLRVRNRKKAQQLNKSMSTERGQKTRIKDATIYIPHKQVQYAMHLGIYVRTSGKGSKDMWAALWP